MEERLHVGPPEPGSERETTFNDSLGSIKDIVMSVVKARQDSTDSEELPFIDALLQSSVPDAQVS